MPASTPPRPRLLVLTQHYRPEPNFVTADVAEHLSSDFDVVVVTAHPNYPGGRFHAGTRWWRPVRTSEGGVTVWRLPMYCYRGRSHLRRMASYLSFVFGSAVWSAIVAGRPEIVWVYHGPFTTGLAALWFRLIGSRVVFTCADLWPESFLAARVAQPGLVMRLMFAYSRAINRIADRLICSTRGTLRRYAADGRPASALCYVPVWVEGIPEPLPAPWAATLPAGAVPAIVYAGNLGPAQHLETVIAAAAALARDGVRVAFDVYGTGVSEPALRELTDRLGAGNVTFHGRVSPQDAFARASRAAGHLVCLRADPLFAMTIPSKLSFAFAAATPILYGLPGESAALVAESGGGVAFDTDAPASLVAAVKTLLALPPDAEAAMRRALRAYYEQHFRRVQLLAHYREIFQAVLRGDAAEAVS